MLLADVDSPRQPDTLPFMTSSQDNHNDIVIVSEIPPCTQDVGCQTMISRAIHVCSRIENKFLQNENKLLKSENQVHLAEKLKDLKQYSIIFAKSILTYQKLKMIRNVNFIQACHGSSS
ncbi:hypothetical protein ACJMK2_042179 [Sinanodonta woodiana]|uniref:Uncharacterized protein n=1 Tax=Sinanodonta woodiana TaxID=1069815 RepID=A0ABD3W8E0_SINWO